MSLPLQPFKIYEFSSPQFTNQAPPKGTHQKTLPSPLTTHPSIFCSSKPIKDLSFTIISSDNETSSDSEKTESDREDHSPQIEPEDSSDYIPDESSDEASSDSSYDEPIVSQRRNYHRASTSNAKKRQRETTDKVRRCTSCGTSETPEWRRNPYNKTEVCNACGLKLAKRFKLENASKHGK